MRTRSSSILLGTLSVSFALAVGSCSHGDRGAGESLKKLPTVKADAEVKEVGEPEAEVGEAEKRVAETKAKTPAAPTKAYPVSGDLRNETVSIPNAGKNTRVTLSQADVSGSYIAMTFDDGPSPENTKRLLDMLQERNIKATFFVLAGNATRNASLIRRMVAEGHEIGNHTVSHIGFSRASNEKIRGELEGCHKAIVDACGVAPTLVRPPYGAVTTPQKQWIFDEFGYTTVMWSVDPRDWQRPGINVVARRLVEATRPGSVLLAHDIHKPTIDAMPQTFDELLRRGFQFVTVSQLMALEAVGSMGPPQVSDVSSPESTVDLLSLGRTGPPAVLRPGARQDGVEISARQWVGPSGI